MKRIVLLVVVAALLWSPAVFAEEQKAASEQVQSKADQGGTTLDRIRALSPEERAKLRERMKNMTPEERVKLREQIRARSGANRQGAEATLQTRAIAAEIAAFKQRHQVTKGELESIKRLAIKEKATETTKALEKLLARNEDQYQRQLKVMEQRLERLQAAQKIREGQQSETNQPAKPEAKPATPSGQPPAKTNQK